MQIYSRLAVSLTLLVVGATTGAYGKEADDSSPTAALRTFYQAIADGDVDLATQVSIADASDKAWIASQASLERAFEHLGAAAVKQFGKDGEALNGPKPVAILPKRIDQIKVQEKGDTAFWPINPKSPLKLTKSNGHWKIDLVDAFPSDLRRELIELNDYISSYLEQAAADIENGEYKDVAEVRAELRRRREGPIKPRADSRPEPQNGQKPD